MKRLQKTAAWMAALLMFASSAGATVFAAEPTLSADTQISPFVGDNSVTVSNWDEFKWSVENASRDTTIFVKNTIIMPRGTGGILDGRGRVTIRRAPGFTKQMLSTNLNVDLTLQNIVFDGGKTQNTDSTGELLIVDSGTLTLGEGTILQNNKNTDYSGGGAAVHDEGTLKINGGVISNCSAKYYGGGVYLNGGTLRLDKGAIKNCSVSLNGGGVYINERDGSYGDDMGTFEMNGGTISNCSANTGGGVYVNLACEFEMDGGSITGCAAKGSGGGVCTNLSGTFHMENGSITKCTAEGNGGGVFISASTFEMTGGTIGGNANDANKASSGSGVYNFGGEMLLDGSSIHLTQNSGDDVSANREESLQVETLPHTGVIRMTPPVYKEGQTIVQIAENAGTKFSKSDLDHFAILEEGKNSSTKRAWHLELSSDRKSMVLKAGSSSSSSIYSPTAITLNQTSLTLQPNQSAQLQATVSPGTALDKTVTWSSSDNAVAVVDSTGKVTAAKNGTAAITAKTSNGKLATCALVVSDSAHTLSLDTTKVNVVKNDSYQFLLRNPVAGVNYTARTENGTVSSVSLLDKSDPRGWKFTMTGLSTGSTNIIVTGDDGNTATLPVQVYSGSIMLDTNWYTMAPGNTYSVGVKLNGIPENKVKVWSSRDSYATVTRVSNGLYQAKALQSGHSYLVFDVLNDAGQVINHASVKIQVEKGVAPGGSATRSLSFIP